ncbi:MAG TPA: inorganic pyrophosphatase [Ktedonobacteraceae bacterium]|jgi:inorganic pyrophosphatase|nr:inorganic pyrophosphatase [Ktedonobacteraceae bacterium]
MEDDFWHALDTLVTNSWLVIDRPRGSAHPRYPDNIYPLDYGYLDGTSTTDQQGIDVWVGSLPEKTLTAIILTVDLLKRDSEPKFLLGCTTDEKQQILALHNHGNQSAILIERAPSAQ